MTAPEFTVDDMIDEVTMVAGFYRGLAGVRIPPGGDDEHGYTRRDRLYRAIAARLSATSADWQPPPEAERPDGFRCLGMWGPRWVVVEWADLGHAERAMGWLPYPNGHSAITPAAFAPLPPTPTQKVTK